MEQRCWQQRRRDAVDITTAGDNYGAHLTLITSDNNGGQGRIACLKYLSSLSYCLYTKVEFIEDKK